jgi:hypothetical protein
MRKGKGNSLGATQGSGMPKNASEDSESDTCRSHHNGFKISDIYDMEEAVKLVKA